MDSLRIPLGFNGFCGQFKELPKRLELDTFNYDKLVQKVLTKQFFLEKELTPLKQLI